MAIAAHLALAERWGVANRSPPAEEEVAELEQLYDVSLPEDFRLYLLQTVPSEGFDDDWGKLWWPISRIRNMPDECGPSPPELVNPDIEGEVDRYLFFADYLDWSCALFGRAEPRKGRPDSQWYGR